MNRVLLIAWLAFAPLAALAQDGVINPQTDASKLTTGTLPAARLGGLGILNNSLGGDVNLNNTANFFDGPSIAQGSTGTWFVSGFVNLTDTAGAAVIYCKLWDGTTTINGSSTQTPVANAPSTITLSGYMASPAGNLRISCRDTTATTGKIVAAAGGIVTSTYIAAFRLQ